MTMPGDQLTPVKDQFGNRDAAGVAVAARQEPPASCLPLGEDAGVLGFYFSTLPAPQDAIPATARAIVKRDDGIGMALDKFRTGRRRLADGEKLLPGKARKTSALQESYRRIVPRRRVHGSDVFGQACIKWTGPGLNRRPKDFQSFALPAELPVPM